MTFARDELIRLITALLAHSLAVAACVLIDYYGIPFYEQMFGSISKFFGFGPMMRTLFSLFVGVNLLIAIIPVLRIKLLLILPLLLLTAYIMFPHNPIRGLVYCSELGLLPLAAIYLSRGLHQLLSPRAKRACAP